MNVAHKDLPKKKTCLLVKEEEEMVLQFSVCLTRLDIFSIYLILSFCAVLASNTQGFLIQGEGSARIKDRFGDQGKTRQQV
jgi:hypothetical protein